MKHNLRIINIFYTLECRYKQGLFFLIKLRNKYYFIVYFPQKLITFEIFLNGYDVNDQNSVLNIGLLSVTGKTNVTVVFLLP